jgi:hypothetical protein
MRVARYLRQHHIGLIALFIALTGTAYAGTQVASHPFDQQAAKATKKKVKRGPRGPQGPAGPVGPAGPQGLTGPAGPAGKPGSSAASVNTGVFQGFFGTHFGAPSGVSGYEATESNVWTLTPAGAPITARDLSMRTPTGYVVPVGDDVSVALRVNGADSALSCSIHGATPAPRANCQDSSHTVTIPPSSLISVRFTWSSSGGTGSPYPVSFGWRAVP